MMKSLDVAATGMKAQEMQLDQIANDMANMNTTAFKRGRTEFQDLMYETIKEPTGEEGVNRTPAGIQSGTGVKVVAQYAMFEPGSAKITGNHLDMMVNGEGFFAVQMPNGQVGYTRDGSFKLDTQGRLITNGGMPVVPGIQIPPNSQNINVSPQGVVSVTNAQGQESSVGQMQLVNFINPAGLKRMGGNLVVPSISSGEPVQGNPGDGILGYIQQGSLESSNVKPTESVMDMIKTQRTYETNAKIMNVADQMWATTNNVGTK